MTDIVLVTVDSLRADHAGWHGYDRPTTSTLDGLAESGHTFINAFAHAGATRASFPSILASTYALMYGGTERLSDDQTLVSEVLSEAGYRTGGFHSNVYLSEEFGYHRGFDQFSDGESEPSTTSRLRTFVRNNLDSDGAVYALLQRLFNATERHAGVELGSIYVDATDLTEEAIDWVEQTSSATGRFLWTHYMDVHHPYLPPIEHQEPFREAPVGEREGTRLRRRMLEAPAEVTEDEHQKLLDLYDAEVRYVDYEIGRLLDRVFSIWGEDTVVIFTADHGEEFREHGAYSHGTLHDEGIHVPLIVADNTSGGVHDELVGLLDISPTIADYAGVEHPENWYGKSLRLLTQNEPWHRDEIVGCWGEIDDAEFYYRDQERKYIGNETDGRLYDLCEDPTEQTDVIGENSEVTVTIRERIAAHREEIAQTHQELDDVDIDDEARERLAMLGYTEE